MSEHRAVRLADLAAALAVHHGQLEARRGRAVVAPPERRAEAYAASRRTAFRCCERVIRSADARSAAAVSPRRRGAGAARAERAPAAAKLWLSSKLQECRDAAGAGLAVGWEEEEAEREQ